VVVVVLGCVACGSNDDSSSSLPTDDAYAAAVRDDMRQLTFEDIHTLSQSADDLCAQVPLHPNDSGWDATEDAAALDGMRVSWRWTRSSFEHIQAVIAPQFPDTLAQLDARYEDFSESVYHPFFASGFEGLHAIERVLWADRIPSQVVEFESTLPNYIAAAWPTTSAEANAFKLGLCGELNDDVGLLESQLVLTTLRVDAIFLELVSSMNVPKDQVTKFTLGADASRYSSRTLADLRDMLAGVRKIYAPYRAWIRGKPNGEKIDARILAGFEALSAAYQKIPGDTLPQAPKGWSNENPSAEDLATPFGELYRAADAAADANDDESLVNQLKRAAHLLGFETE
jgi:iron uptake system component EfeO